MENIEDTIFDNALPVNPFPMVKRLLELMNENLKQGKNWKQDKRIERLMYLIIITYAETQTEINLNDWWMQLSAQHEGETQPCNKL
ncbi:MAG: hypothetical protein WC365_08765 [Candidatus Babeliales bacterium]|jgi:hypothetical protein